MQEAISVTRIISGGQTGADQGGLAAAVTLGLATGGWAPKGWRTDTGPAPWLARLGLQEHPSASYPPRTRANVESSDGTLVVSARRSAGTDLTIRLAQQCRKPLLVISLDDVKEDLWSEATAVQAWIRKFGIQVLNVAGNRESVAPGIARVTHDLLVAALQQG